MIKSLHSRSHRREASRLNIRISADSTCDLSPELLQKYSIAVLPMYVTRDGEALRDGSEITPPELFASIDRGCTCGTASASVGDYMDFYAAMLEGHDAVLHFTVSSCMSSCYQNAVQAALEFPGRVYPVDAKNLSSAIGLLAIRARELADEGMEPYQISDAMNALREKLDASFVLDTLHYLHKGGRCSGLAALGANLLQLKPCIEVVDGQMQVGRKYRGRLLKCQTAYIRDRLTGRDDPDYRRIFCTGTVLSDETKQALREVIASTGPWEEILFTEAGCTIASHCGPQCMGVLFFRK